MPAVCEEITFRGIVFSGMLTRKKVWIAMMITSFFFAVFHLSLHRFPGVFLIGLGACFVVWISGSIWTGILLHALSNGFVSIIALYPQYDLLGINEMLPSPYALIGVVLIAIAVLLGNRKPIKSVLE